MRKKLKTIPKVKASLQLKFNKFIRERDSENDDMGECISCGQWMKLQAGHYFAVSGYDSLRFDKDNVHGECAYCNCFNESHLITYRQGLVKRYGIFMVEDLEDKGVKAKKNFHKWTREDLEIIRQGL